MVLAPLVGLVLAAVVAAVLWLLGGGSVRPRPTYLVVNEELANGFDGSGLAPLLGAAVVLALLALLTRGIHLDGLADTADGLGSGRDPEGALAVMRRGDVGPFGMATLLLVLLLQLAALDTLLRREHGVAEVAVALVLSRVALPLVCSHDVPAARADGLGHQVAGTVSRPALLVAAVFAIVAVAVCLLLDLATAPAYGQGPFEQQTGDGWLLLVAVLVLPLLAAGLLAARCVRRLGGITGDVLGSCVEVAFTVALVVLAVG
jgi:adenosylcobinamide-GDP ribazoletransferase